MDRGESNIGRDFGTEYDKRLKKALSRWELLFMSLGTVIGSGWLLASLDASLYTGPSAILSWMIGGILALFIGLVYAELGSMIPKSGGIARYPHYTHGGLTGFIISWTYFITYSTGPAIEAEAATLYLSHYYPQLSTSATVNGIPVQILTPYGLGLAVLLMIIFFFINYAGVNILGKITHGVGWWKLLVPTLTAIFLLIFYFHPSNFTATGFIPSSKYVLGGSIGIYGFDAVLFAIPSTGIIFSYLGFRQAIEYSGEGKNPSKDLPFALIGAILISMLVYTLLQVSFIGGVNWSALYLNESSKLVPVTAGNWSALSSAVTKSGIAISTSPFLTVYSIANVRGPILALFTIWGIILIIDAVISPSGSGWVNLGTSTRTLYAMSANGYLPNIFLKLGRTRIPIYSLITSVLLGIIFLLPFPSWYLLVSFSSAAAVFTYVYGGISLITLRKVAPEMHRTYKTPIASILAPLATISAALIVYWTGFTTLFYIITTILIGLPIFFGYYTYKVLGMEKIKAVLLGILDIVVALTLTVIFYLNTGGATTANNIFFAIYIGGLIALFAVELLLTHMFLPKEYKKEIISGLWLVIFILAMLIASYFGSFGLYIIIPFPYDSLVVIAVSLAIYYLGIKTGIRTKAIDELIQLAKQAP
ncbi:MAG: APC family permease [Sulfolobus sp.]